MGKCSSEVKDKNTSNSCVITLAAPSSHVRKVRGCRVKQLQIYFHLRHQLPAQRQQSTMCHPASWRSLNQRTELSKEQRSFSGVTVTYFPLQKHFHKIKAFILPCAHQTFSIRALEIFPSLHPIGLCLSTFSSNFPDCTYTQPTQSLRQRGLESTFHCPDVGDVSQATEASHRQAKAPWDQRQRGNYTRKKSQSVCFFRAGLREQ